MKKRDLLPWEIVAPVASDDPQLPSGRHGRRMRVGTCIIDMPNDMAWAFFPDGTYYEKNVAYWLETLLSRTRGRVFYDVGANYGYYCLLLAGKAKRIHAFEPVSATRRVLQRNIRANQLTHVRVHRFGLSDQRRQAQIHLYGCSGKNSVFPMTNVREPLLGTEAIALAPLDELFGRARLAPPDVIKIDIEGGELAALKGARRVIERFQPVLVLEYLDWQFKDAGYRRADLLAELERSNYLVYGLPEEISNLRAYPIARAGGIKLANIIALPASKKHLVTGA